MINSIQLDSLVKTTSSELPRTTVSNDAIEVTKQDVLPNTEKRNVAKTDVKLNEDGGPIDVTSIDGQMNDINTKLQKLQNYLKFEKDTDSGRMVIYVKDSETGDVLRQIPTKEFLAISKSISQYLDMSKQISEKNSPPVGMFTNETV